MVGGARKGAKKHHELVSRDFNHVHIPKKLLDLFFHIVDCQSLQGSTEVKKWKAGKRFSMLFGELSASES